MNSLLMYYEILFRLEVVVTLAPSIWTAVMSVSMSDDIRSELELVFTLVAYVWMSVMLPVNMSDNK